jgi:hypothetical protein
MACGAVICEEHVTFLLGEKISVRYRRRSLAGRSMLLSLKTQPVHHRQLPTAIASCLIAGVPPTMNSLNLVSLQ